MTLFSHHRHECTTCGNVAIYHVFDHESEGDIVTAFCSSCDEDTYHRIGAFYA
jgi:hypothetical protein